MIPAATSITELFLSSGALVSLFVLRRVLMSRDGWDPINRRLLFCVHVAMLLFVGRVLLIIPGWSVFRVVTLTAAGLIPIGALVLTEGLLRRHAPPWIKLFISCGTVLFVVSAFWYSADIDSLRLMGLLSFQCLGFFMCGTLILTRDKGSLTIAENTMVIRLGLSLILFIPMALGDFLLVSLGLPIQFSAVSVLILCWLAVGLGRPHLGHKTTLTSLAMMVGASVLVGVLVGFLADFDRDETMLTTALIVTMVFLIAIFDDARSLRAETHSIGLLQHMATAATDDPLAFLRDLRSHPLVEGAVIIDNNSLDGLQAETIKIIFAAAPVLRRANPPDLGSVADDHIAYLFDHYSATHIILAAHAPRVLIALAMPSLNASPQMELELTVLQRMAALMSQQQRKG